MPIQTPDVCQTCNGPHPRADGYMPRHPFNDGSLPPSATFGVRRADGTRGPAPASQRGPEGPSGTPPPIPWPFDPVLRQALIDKGVLTPEDLRNAEDKIRAVTATFEGSVNGQ